MHESGDDSRWQAVLERDASADDSFYYAVRTSGIYCRPSCPSRRPRRENVTFFATHVAAEAAGFRPCLRCRPAQPSTREYVIARVKSLIEGGDVIPTLSDLGQAVGLSPGRYRRRGKGERIWYGTVETPLGRMLLAATERGLCAVRVGIESEMVAELHAEFGDAELVHKPEAIAGYLTLILERLSGKDSKIALDLSPTDFQRRVWAALMRIPYGQTRSYREVAAMVGQPTAVRAVASACAANPVALVVPCHRVIRTGGEISGYRWGIELKRRLLADEQAASRDQS